MTLLYAIRFLKTKKNGLCEEEEELKNQIGIDLYSNIEEKKESCVLDLIKRNFDTMCFDLNEILIRHKFFLRVYELKDKFRYLFQENQENKKIIRRVSSCIKEKFNGFTFAQINLAKSQTQDLIPINIIYKPVKKQHEVIVFFTDDIKNAFRAVYSTGQEIHNANQLYECSYCSDFFVNKSKFEKHIRICGKKPGVLYDFSLQNVVTFEDNIKYRGDILFCVYADFETTAHTGVFINPENTAMFAVSY